MDYVEQFLDYLLFERRSSELTVKAYSIDLKMFAKYLEEAGLGAVCDATTRQIRRYMMCLLSSGYEPRSVNRKVASLRSFYRYLCTLRLLKKNPCDVIVSVRGPKKLPVFLHEEQMSKMLDADSFESTFESQRDRTILQLLYLSGIRLSELVNLTVGQIDMSLQQIVVFGKRKKQRIIPITPFLKSIFISYLQYRNNDFGYAQPSDRLFLTSKGEPIYPKLVYRIVHRHIEMVSTVSKKSPHVIRHTFATVLLNNGADLMAIKELLGHSSLAATQIYAHNDFEQLNHIYKMAHPRAEN